MFGKRSKLHLNSYALLPVPYTLDGIYSKLQFGQFAPVVLGASYNYDFFYLLWVLLKHFQLYKCTSFQNMPLTRIRILLQGSQFGKPSIGPKESEKNVRHFTDEQLSASNTVISLQYGSNKGANQAGMSFGTTRHM